MKLHLPKSLRSAVLACLAVAGGFTTTVGTGFVAGGTLAIAFAGNQALAVDVTTTTEWTSSESWTEGENAVVSNAATLTLSGTWTDVDRSAVELHVKNGSTALINMAAGSLLKVGYLNIHSANQNVGDTVTLQNGTLDVTGTGTKAIRVGHWGGNAVSKLNIAGGTLRVKDTSVNVGWDSTGALEQTGGTTILKGIVFDQNVWSHNSYASLQGGLMCIGSSGITCPTGNATLTLSGGTFAGYEDTLSTANRLAINVTGAAVVDTTKYNLADNGYEVSAGTAGTTVTVNGAVTVEAAGNLTVQGAGVLNMAQTVTNNGTITLNTTVNLASSQGVKAPLETNGMEGATTYALFTGSGTVVEGDNLKWMVDGVEVAKENISLDGGVLSVTGTPIYVLADANAANTDEAAFGAKGYRLQGDNLTLTLTDTKDADLENGIEIVGDNSTVVLSQGTSLTNATFKRTGGTLNITIADGCTFTSDYNGGSPVYNGDVTVQGGGNLILSQNDALGWGDTATNKLILEGAEDKKAVVTLGGRQTQATDIEMKGNALISANGIIDPSEEGYNTEVAPSFDTYGGTFTVSGKNNEIAVNIYGRDGSADPVTFDVAANGELKISGGILQRAFGPTNFAKAGEGLLQLTGKKTEFAGTFENLAGTTQVLTNAAFNGGISVAEGSVLELGTAGTEITLGHAITNKGAITLSGIIKISDTAELEIMPAGYTDGANGYEIVGGYVLVNGDGTVDASDATIMYNGQAVDLVSNNGKYTITPPNAEVGTIYCLNTGDLTLDGTNAAVEAATGFELAEGTTLVLSGESAVNPLPISSGAGNITLNKDVSLSGGQVSQATGTLTISEGVTLSIGTGQGQSNSISSFSAVVLDGGSIYFNNSKDTFNNVTVTEKGSTCTFYDMDTAASGAKAHFAGTTTLDGALVLNATYNTQIGIDKLTGVGSFATGQGSEDMVLEIGALKQYSGDMTVNGVSRFDIDTMEQYSGDMTVNGVSRFDINTMEQFSGTVTVSNTNLTLGGGTDSTGSVTATGGTLLIESAQNLGVTITTNNTAITFGPGVSSLDGAVAINGGEQHVNTSSLTFNGDVSLNNSNLAPWEASGVEGASITFNGNVTGNGNFISRIDGATYTFAGDTSGWTPSNMRFLADTTIKYTGTTTINANEMRAENGALLNMVIDNSAAVTVKGAIGKVGGSLAIVVEGTGAVTFENALFIDHTITGNGGSLTLKDLNIVGKSTLKTEALGNDANGFIDVKRLIATGFGTITAPDAVSVDGTELTPVNADGKLYFTESAGTVYQVTKQVNYSEVSTEDRDKATEFVVANEATLVLNTAMTNDVSITNGGTVKLAGVTDNMNKISGGGDVYFSSENGSTDYIRFDSPVTDKSVNLSISDDGTVLINSGDYNGAITVLEGQKVKYANSNKSVDLKFSAVGIEKDAIFDLNGCYDLNPITVTLYEGGTLANSSTNATGQNGYANLTTIVVNGDSYVDIANGSESRMIGGGHGATSLQLNGNTLTKKGGGAFYMQSTNISGGGTIAVAQGILELRANGADNANIIAPDVNFTVDSGAQLIIGDNVAPTVDSVSGDGTLYIRNGRTLTLTEGTSSVATIMAGDGSGHNVNIIVEKDAVLKLPTEISNGTLHLKGAGTFDLGDSFEGSDKVRLANDWTGVTKVTGATIAATDTVDVSTLMNNVSSMLIEGLTVEDGGALTLGGKVQMGGAINLADAITNDGAAVTFADGVTLDLVNLASSVNEAGKIVFTLFEGDDVDLSMLSVANLSEATKTMFGANAAVRTRSAGGVEFGTDGTITLAEMTQEWQGTADDNNVSGANWTAGSELREGASVLFAGEGTGEVVVDKAATVKDVTVTAGDYNIVDNEELTIGGNVSLTGGSLTMANGLSMGGSYTQTAGTLDTSSLVSTGTDTTISISGGTVKNTQSNDALVLDGATIGNATVSNVTIQDSTVAGQLTMDGNLTFEGTIIVDKTNIAPELIEDTSVYAPGNSDAPSQTGSGFETTAYIATIVTGTTGTLTDNAEWKDSGNASANVSFEESTGKVTVQATSQGDSYYVNADGETVYSAENVDAGQFINTSGTAAKTLVLNGGSLKLSTALAETMTDGITVAYEGISNVTLDGATLDKSSLNGADDTHQVALDGDGVYNLDDDAAPLELGTGISLADTWAGTVQLADDLVGDVADITRLSNDNSAVRMGSIEVNRLVSGTAAAVTATGDMLLKNGASALGGDLAAENIVLGTADTAATLNVAGALSASEGDQVSLTLNHVESTLTADSLTAGTLNIIMDNEIQSAISGMDGGVVIITLDQRYTNGTTLLNGNTPGMHEEGEKYFGSLVWTNDNTTLKFTSIANENWLKENMAGVEENAMAGATLLDDAFATYNPQLTDKGSDIANVLDTIEGMLEAGDTEGAAEVSAAVAGASVATVGMALSGDVERQLQAIRNRTTTMGVNECVVNEGMPYFNAWVNAEGNRAELDKDGLAAGYTLDSWGGTVGFDVDLNPNLTMGLAVTAMYGDLDSEGPDRLSGDMDTAYVSLFARYASCAWTHTFVGTIGKMDGNYERTVNAAGLNYETEGELEGMTFGLMYEVGYVMPLNEDATACLQPIFNVMLRHSTVDSYTEDGGDAALEVDEQTMTTLTFGLGTRFQAVVGENTYNRASLFEARVLGKADVGDRSSEADVAFLGGNAGATVESAELGAFGVEIGAGLSIPMGDDDGTIFIDASAEFRSGYTNMNGTVGYRINF